MKVIFGSAVNLNLVGPYACALGFFDGVHIGHQKLIETLKDISNKNNLKSMVFTFENHPMTLLNKGCAPKLITDNNTKTKVFEKLGIDVLVYCDINKGFLNTRAQSFVKDILIGNLNVNAVIAGFNFRFGFKGEGNSNYLLSCGKKLGIDVNIVNPVYMDGKLVSSTTIREFLRLGNVAMANSFLGRPYSIRGKVVHGEKRGRGMGFPTANICFDENLAIPDNGVYVTKVDTGSGVFDKIGVTNIGHNPTFGANPKSIETHILDFDDDLYEKELNIEFYERIRGEMTFKSPSELTDQVNRDKSYASDYFKNMHVYK